MSNAARGVGFSGSTSRKHPTLTGVDRLLGAASGGRNGFRDRCLPLLFQHGLRVPEVCGPGLSRMDPEGRVPPEGGLSTTHPLRMDELRAIEAWLRERARMNPEIDAFFVSERRVPLSRKTAWAMIRAHGRRAGQALPAHPNMPRHACGFALADQGADTRLIQDYLGHRNIRHAVRCTANNPTRFEKSL